MSSRMRGKWISGPVLGAATVGVMGLLVAGLASAQPPPDPCSPAEFMRAHAGTIHKTADYVETHPEVQQAIRDAWNNTTPEERQNAVKEFMDSRPDVAAAEQDIQQPLKGLAVKCGLPAPNTGLGGPA